MSRLRRLLVLCSSWISKEKGTFSHTHSLSSPEASGAFLSRSLSVIPFYWRMNEELVESTLFLQSLPDERSELCSLMTVPLMLCHSAGQWLQFFSCYPILLVMGTTVLLDWISGYLLKELEHFVALDAKSRLTCEFYFLRRRLQGRTRCPYAGGDLFSHGWGLLNFLCH